MTAASVTLTIRIGTIALGTLALAACSDHSSPPDFHIEVRSSGGLVSGNDFTCIGTWPSPWTPCEDARPATAVMLDELGILHLKLYSAANPDDGQGSVAYLDLTFDPNGQLDAEGREVTILMPNGSHMHEVSAPRTGWIDPATTAGTPAGRNAGRFSLTFPWGGISGTYDTASSPSG